MKHDPFLNDTTVFSFTFSEHVSNGKLLYVLIPLITRKNDLTVV